LARLYPWMEGATRYRGKPLTGRTRQLEERLQSQRWLGEWDLVFTTPSGAPVNGRVVLAAFQRMLRRAGLPKVRFHDLRHACSSLLQAKGISAKVVQEELEHSDLSITLRYTKVLPELDEAAARRMEEVLTGTDNQESVAGGCQDGCQDGTSQASG
jgi:integrase